MEHMRLKGEILGVGQAFPHEPDGLGRTWTVTGWVADGGDFPALDLAEGSMCGWSPGELALIAAVARNCGEGAALGVAACCRQMPLARAAGTIPAVIEVPVMDE